MEPKRRRIAAALSASIVLLFIALPAGLGFAQQIPHWHRECAKAFKQFQTKPKHKAFAVTHMSSGGVSGIACGYAWGYPSKTAAEVAAIRTCQKSAGPCAIKQSD
jgi:hypothetical protein